MVPAAHRLHPSPARRDPRPHLRRSEVRSALVHKGQVDSSKLHKLRSGEDKVSAEKVVALAIDVCAKLIWEILRRQDIPDWAHFDIVEHSEPDGGLDRASEATHRAADSGE